VPGAGPPSSPLAHPDWQYVEKPTLDDFRAEDWIALNAQRGRYYAERQAEEVLAMLSVGKDLPTYGYQINNYRHCLQSATMMQQSGLDEEMVVVGLLHDIGFVACPTMHGEFSAALLGAYISEQNYWMLRHHQVFQQFHLHEYPGVDRHEREQWRGHPHFEWTATFVERYDQNAIDPAYDTAPLEFFVPMVKRLFARSPRPILIDKNSSRG
jgi:predicted HD phosphohydrolase